VVFPLLKLLPARLKKEKIVCERLPVIKLAGKIVPKDIAQQELTNFIFTMRSMRAYQFFRH